MRQAEKNAAENPRLTAPLKLLVLVRSMVDAASGFVDYPADFHELRGTVARKIGKNIKVVRANLKLGEMGPIFCIYEVR
ncbi:MAG TPA: hypothetical protein VGN12_22395 [Pirellulales bacterium]